MEQEGAGTDQPVRPSRKVGRRARKSNGNGRDAAGSSPRLRDVLFKDLRPTDLPSNFGQDLKRLYRFYLDEERRGQRAPRGRVWGGVQLPRPPPQRPPAPPFPRRHPLPVALRAVSGPPRGLLRPA